MGSGKKNCIDALNLARQMVKDFEEKQEIKGKQGDENKNNTDEKGQGSSGDSDGNPNNVDDSLDGDNGDHSVTDNKQQEGKGDAESEQAEINDEDQGQKQADQGAVGEADVDPEESEGGGGESQEGNENENADEAGRGEKQGREDENSDSASNGQADNTNSQPNSENGDANEPLSKDPKLSVNDLNADLSEWDDALDTLQSEIERIASESLDNGTPMAFSTACDKVKVLKDAGDLETYKRWKGELGKLNILKAKLVKLFLTKQICRWEFDKEEGRINTRKLASVKAGNRAVFKQKRVSQSIDTAITLLCDFSGSMGSHGVKNVMKATIMFLEALRTAKIETEVLGFTTTGNKITGAPIAGGYAGWAQAQLFSKWARLEPIVTYVIKAFNEPFSSKVKRRIAIADDAAYAPRKNNSDPDSVLVAYDRLKKQPQRRKIMFVLSDGAPNARGNNELKVKHLKQLVVDLEKKGVEMIGIGMGHDVSDLYPKSIYINNTNSIAATIFKELEKIL
jgi:cobaltochelatase CobT